MFVFVWWIVAGAYWGKGRKAGLKTVYLMGCKDERTGEWKTVCKASSGLTDKEVVVNFFDFGVGTLSVPIDRR